MGLCVFAQLNHYPAPPHFVGDRASSSRARKRIKNEITNVGRQMNDSMEQPLRFRRVEHVFCVECLNLILCFVIVTNFIVKPYC
jgi:hypothetical protein